MKPLSEMSLRELWQLFPIFLTEPNPRWHDWYEEEALTLKNLLSESDEPTVSHIGSTAIHVIWAKPIIDILVELPTTKAITNAKEILIDHGYLCMSESDERVSLNKGYTENGFTEKVYHIHLRRMGDRDEVYFRDYLNRHPDTAKEYEMLKLRLWKQYEHDRDGYTEAKTEFVRTYTAIAKSQQSNSQII